MVNTVQADEFDTVDDGTTIGYTQTGPWARITTGGFNGDYRRVMGEKNTAMWIFGSVDPGRYDIQVTWVPDPSNTTVVLYEILVDEIVISSVRNIDQRQAPVGPQVNGTTFQSLRIFNITSGGSLRVRLRTQVNSAYTVADAVRVVKHTDSIGAFDPSTATWHLRNENSAGTSTTNPFSYGGVNWKPVIGDWNKDGLDTVGVVEPSANGFATWYLRNSNSAGAPDITPFQYGLASWIPVIGDWDGDRTTTIGVYEPLERRWYIGNENSAGSSSVTSFRYGPLNTNTIPIAGGTR
jgi:hypothetical protein